ncbi:MAG: MFS transporter [Chloroflexi bacterium]|nr:MFS transporter [Chloroflexota bacterium]MCI0577842.1 MFS transporter [Chloroflexota bacterium]MCI0646139.1 MFS transporter [Chloroflexota bacterium]MCI0732071.1 MFS transporter [Chloroflexota bacterium]
MNTVKQIQRTYYLILSLFWLATAMRAVLVVLLMESRGVNLFQIGLLMGGYSLAVVLLEVPTGGLADAIGRKRVTLLAYSFMLLSGVVFLFAFSFPAFLLAWLLAGLARALSSGALDAWFVDSVQAAEPGINIQPSLAHAGTFSTLALGGGTLLAGLIPRFFGGLPADGTVVLTPLSVPIVFAVALDILLLLAAAWLILEERPAAGDGTAGWRQAIRQVPVMIKDAVGLSRQNSTFVILLGTSLAAGAALSSMESFWQPHFARLVEGAAENTLFFGAVMAGNFLVAMVGNLLATPLGRLLRQRYGLMAAVFQGIQGAMLITLALQTNQWTAVALFWLVYLNVGILNSPVSTLVNQEIPASHRSSMLSIFSLASYTGGFLGSAGLGYLAEHGSIPLVWIVAGALLVVSLFLFVQVEVNRMHRERHNEQQASLLANG